MSYGPNQKTKLRKFGMLNLFHNNLVLYNSYDDLRERKLLNDFYAREWLADLEYSMSHAVR